MPISELTRWEANPRRITLEARAHLRKSIEKYGLVQDIVVNQKGRIISGHQRYDILVEMGEIEVSVIEVDLDEADEIQLNLAMNNPESQGVFVNEMLVDIALTLENFEVPLEDLQALGLEGLILDGLAEGLTDDELEGDLLDSLQDYDGKRQDSNSDEIKFNFGYFKSRVLRNIYEKFRLVYERYKERTGKAMVAGFLEELLDGKREKGLGEEPEGVGEE